MGYGVPALPDWRVTSILFPMPSLKIMAHGHQGQPAWHTLKANFVANLSHPGCAKVPYAANGAGILVCCTGILVILQVYQAGLSLT